ncbi:DUF1772 domain-containing protein [Gracilimonas mengyeensis]|uniref:Uncharacterized membrane protein n=1 Tax=Gracilimonas mengyeensis TaxID=1302730 RepID=A0A521DIQ7_9BACT|nr:DUF1772 domain-containing protein [Gracilimonas mengyeensis]SMO71472.1 Uncharacterized membrane protein [Gracilimonas mengyeensis]
MEFTLNQTVLYLTVLLTGLSAGLFYAWQVSVIPGTKRIKDATYIETMQKINRAIINPFFMLIFLGSLAGQILSFLLYWNTTLPFMLILVSTILYGVGTVIVTGLGNVPLNDALDKLFLDDLSEEQLSQERQNYEASWNKLHLIRTVFSVLAFTLLLAAAFLTS